MSDNDAPPVEDDPRKCSCGRFFLVEQGLDKDKTIYYWCDTCDETEEYKKMHRRSKK